MKSDFEVISHKFDNDIIIYPISDIHLGASEHLEKEWKDFCDSRCGFLSHSPIPRASASPRGN